MPIPSPKPKPKTQPPSSQNLAFFHDDDPNEFSIA